VTGVVHQAKTVTTYDANDNPLTVTTSDLVGGDPARSTTYVYNADDMLTSVTEGLGRTTNYDYDEVGNTILTTGARGTSDHS
jgi:large repetitive protein